MQEGPLGVDCYGDELLYCVERQRLFNPAVGPLYLGHDLLLPSAGHVRADGDDRVLLARCGPDDLRAFANVCTHALRPLVTAPTPSTSSCIVCPFHSWSFRRDGRLIGGRDISFSADEREELRLRQFPTRAWHGLHFGGSEAAGPSFGRQLAGVERSLVERGLGGWLDFSEWVAVEEDDEPYRGDWKTFMEVYGDCYHVPAYHDGLASFADCTTLEWHFEDSVHLQFVRLSERPLRRSAAYGAWVEGLHDYYGARGEPVPTTAVVWSAFYPNLMLELYNGLRVSSVILPTGPDSYVNRVHYYVPADMERLVPGLPAAILAAYRETAVQDRVLNEARHDGVVTTRELGLDLAPYHYNLGGLAPELGTRHFHRWWRARMGR